MEFPFTYHMRVGDVMVAEIEGVAIIEADAANTWPGRSLPEWSVESIEVYAIDTSSFDRVTLPEDNPLHDPIMLHVLSKHREQIDDEWAAWIGAQIGRARARFDVAIR